MNIEQGRRHKVQGTRSKEETQGARHNVQGKGCKVGKQKVETLKSCLLSLIPPSLLSLPQTNALCF